MRCLSIADASAKAGEKSVFATAGDDFIDVIIQHGHTCEILETDHEDMCSEQEKIKKLCMLYRPKILIVDSYYVTFEYLFFLHQLCHEINCMLTYVDDTTVFAYPCDILINYNIYGPEREREYKRMYKAAGIELPVLLLGSLYAPLRAEFQNLPDRILEKDIKNIFISTGGADAEHMGLKIVEAIQAYEKKKEETGATFHFVIGGMNEDKGLIEDISRDISSIVLYYNISNMCELMRSCDIAISAAGSTLYELCAAQTPCITYILADNQIPAAHGFEKRGILKNCGDIREISPIDLAGKLLDEIFLLAEDYNERLRIARRMRDMVDGQGADRIVEKLGL